MSIVAKSRRDVEVVRNVSDDLAFLSTEWDQEVSDASLRRSSVVLRRLLVENELGQAWRAGELPRQPIISAPSLEDALKGIPFQRVRWAQAGGASYKGMTVMTPAEFAFAMRPEQIRQRAMRGLPMREFSVRRLMESACVVVEGVLVSRRLLIRYVAHKLGGAHPVDPHRDSSRQDDRAFELLDKVRGDRIVAEKCAIYFELLSIGQAMVSSESAQLLIRAASTRPRA